MRFGELDVRFEADDQDNFNALDVIQNLKDLLSELAAYDKVSLVIVSVPEDDDSVEDLDHEEDGEAV